MADNAFGKFCGDVLQLHRLDAPTDHQPKANLFQIFALVDAEHIARHRQNPDRKQQQTPARAMKGCKKKKGRVGRKPRHCPVKVEDRNIHDYLLHLL